MKREARLSSTVKRTNSYADQTTEVATKKGSELFSGVKYKEGLKRGASSTNGTAIEHWKT